MSVRVYLRSPIALAWTLAAVVAVGLVVAAGWRLAGVLASTPAVSNPAFLDGLGGIAVSIFVGLLALGAAFAVWLPCSVAIAYAVGRSVREQPTTLAATVDAVRIRSKPLYRWAKTRTAVGPLADRILTDDDVSPAEVAVGCDSFVVPALALDAPTLPFAVERANRVVPPAGRERVLLVGFGATAVLAIGGAAAGLYDGSAVPPASLLVAGAIVVGGVLTAALDVAWRTGVYATADLSDGFST